MKDQRFSYPNPTKVKILSINVYPKNNIYYGIKQKDITTISPDGQDHSYVCLENLTNRLKARTPKLHKFLKTYIFIKTFEKENYMIKFQIIKET